VAVVDAAHATMMVRLNPHTSLALRPQTSKAARKKASPTLKRKRPNATIGPEKKTRTNAMIRTSTPGSTSFTTASKRSTLRSFSPLKLKFLHFHPKNQGLSNLQRTILTAR
jgi:hypothetical protein